MKRISPESYPSPCVTTASVLAALVAAVAATAIATAAAVAVISGSGAGSALGSAIFIAAVLAAAASGLLAACIASPPPPPTPTASISEDTSGRQIVIPLTTVQDGLKTLIQFTKSRQPRPSRRRPPKKRHLPDEPLPTPLPIPKPNTLTSVAFHERCGRILQTCDLLIRHFPASRTLCILRTAEGILARRPQRAVEPESTWESDIDVDLDPVLSAPDLDEALRRLDQRIRSAKKYKERNERLQSTSLVLEAEKRRAIRSSAEQYLEHDDSPTPDDPPERITTNPVDNDNAAFCPKPKARSSLFQVTYPALPESSSYIPQPYNEPPTEDVSLTLPSTEESTGFISSHNDFTSSVVEMNSGVITKLPSESSERVNSEFSSSSLEKETENVAVSQLLIENAKDQANCDEIMNKMEVNISSSPTEESLYTPPKLIVNDVVLPTVDEEVSSSETEKKEEPLLPGSSSITIAAEKTPYPVLVAEFSEDSETENWSAIVEAVACGKVETELVLTTDTKDSAFIVGEAAAKASGCETTGASSQDETVRSHSPSIPVEELTLPVTTGEAESDCKDTDVSSLGETSASIETGSLTPVTQSEDVLILFSGTVSSEESIPFPPNEVLPPPVNRTASSVCNNADATSLEDGTIPSYSTSSLADNAEENTSLTKKEAVSPLISENDDALLENTVPTTPSLIDKEDSTLTRNSASSVSEKTRSSSPTKLASPSFDLKTHDNVFPYRKNSLSVYSSKTDNLEVPDTTNVLGTTTSSESFNGNKTISECKETVNNTATSFHITASTETHSDNIKDNNVDSGLTTITEEDIVDVSISRRASLSSVKSTLTLDLKGRPKIEYEFEQLLENTSPPTGDIEASFTAVSSDILTLDEDISDEGKRIDTYVSTSVDTANEVSRLTSNVSETAIERIKDSEILISDSEEKLWQSDSERHHKDLETPSDLREKTHRGQNTKVILCITSEKEDFVTKLEQPSIEENEAAADLQQKPSFTETESKFDSEIPTFGFNLGTEEKSDCASDSSSMSVSPNPDISLLRTYETNSTLESSRDAIKVDFPVEKKELAQQTTGTLDDFGFGEPLLVVKARKVTTYVDDTVSPTPRKERNLAQKRRVRICTEGLDSGDMSEVRERKVGRPLVRRGSKYNFEPVCRDVSPPESNICKPLKPEALRPFSGCVKDEEAVPGHFFRSLERREEARPSTFDHSSSFPLSMRVPHRRAFWDYKMKERESESPKRQPSIQVTGIVQKCKETLQTLSTSPPDGSSPTTIQENDLPGNHQRRFQEARCFFQSLEGKSEPKSIPVEPKCRSDPIASPVVQPKKRMQPATVAERFNVTGIYQDVLGEGAAKTAAGAPLRGVPRREAVVATLHSFGK